MENSTGKTIRRKTNFNFGVRGWLLCLYSMVGYMMIGSAFWCATAQNVVVASLADNIGTDSSTLLSWTSYTGWIAVIGLLIMALLFAKFKTRIMVTVVMIVSGIVFILYGRVSSIVGYAVCYFLVDVFANTTSSVGLPQIAAAYFPTKKGSFLGWATIGANLASLISLSILNSITGAKGIAAATLFFGILAIIIGLINLFFIPNTPEEAGVEPDNGDFTAEELKAHKAMMAGSPVWTLKEAAKNKNFWLIPIAYGLLFMASNGFVSQMVPYQISMGQAPATASMYMKILPIFALPGSILSGWIDQKIGTRRTGMIMAAFYIIAGVFGGFVPYNSVSNWVFLCSFFFWTGAMANLPMSHAISVFGPRDYPGLWARMMPIMALVRITSPLVLAYSLTAVGTYRGAYGFFGIMAIIALVLIYFTNSRIDKKPGKAAEMSYKD